MIKYDPNELLKKIAPKKKIEKLLKSNLTVNKAALSFVDDIDFIDKKSVTEVALKTVNGYKKRVANEIVEAGFDTAAGKELSAEIVDNPKQLIQRIQNELVFQISESIKENYRGESYTWLPSDADEPDPEHQLNYGKKFIIGQGEMPGERIGCRCGMEIDVKQNKLELG